jgi:hypothetical protein
MPLICGRPPLGTSKYSGTLIDIEKSLPKIFPWI